MESTFSVECFFAYNVVWEKPPCCLAQSIGKRFRQQRCFLKLGFSLSHWLRKIANELGRIKMQMTNMVKHNPNGVFSNESD